MMKNQVIRNAYVIEILWHCNVVEPVIKDVIVTEEYHVLHFMLHRWPLSWFLKSLIEYSIIQFIRPFEIISYNFDWKVNFLLRNIYRQLLLFYIKASIMIKNNVKK